MHLEVDETPAGAEGAEGALALFGPGGHAEVCDPGFLSAVGALHASPHPEDPNAFWCAHGFERAAQRPHHFQKDGRWYVCSLRWIQSHALASIRDVTDTVEAEADRQGFLSVAAHDLRGPLANVRSYASLLLSPRMGLDERARRGVEVMGRNADRALHLTQALFDLWKHELGALSFEPELQGVLALLRDEESSARERAGRLEIYVDAHTPAELPDLFFDAERLRTILHTFWANALSRTSPGGGIGSWINLHPQSVEVVFWDSGPTLSGVEMAHAFNRDYVVSHRRKLDVRFELCVAAAAIRAHGGTVAVTQERTKSLFSFTLPKPGLSPAPTAG